MRVSAPREKRAQTHASASASASITPPNPTSQNPNPIVHFTTNPSTQQIPSTSGLHRLSTSLAVVTVSDSEDPQKSTTTSATSTENQHKLPRDLISTADSPTTSDATPSDLVPHLTNLLFVSSMHTPNQPPSPQTPPPPTTTQTTIAAPTSTEPLLLAPRPHAVSSGSDIIDSEDPQNSTTTSATSSENQHKLPQDQPTDDDSDTTTHVTNGTAGGAEQLALEANGPRPVGRQLTSDWLHSQTIANRWASLERAVVSPVADIIILHILRLRTELSPAILTPPSFTFHPAALSIFETLNSLSDHPLATNAKKKFRHELDQIRDHIDDIITPLFQPSDPPKTAFAQLEAFEFADADLAFMSETFLPLNSIFTALDASDLLHQYLNNYLQSDHDASSHTSSGFEEDIDYDDWDPNLDEDDYGW